MGAGHLGQGVLQNKLMIDNLSLSSKRLVSTRVGRGMHHPADTLGGFYHLSWNMAWDGIPRSNFDIPHRFAMMEAFPPENKQMEKNPPTRVPPDHSRGRMELSPFSPE